MAGGVGGGVESGGQRADRDLWLGIRQALLLFVDVIERHEQVSPRTSELRRMWRDGRLGDTSQEAENVV